MPAWAGLGSWGVVELLLQPFTPVLEGIQEALVVVEFTQVGLALGLQPRDWGLLYQVHLKDARLCFLHALGFLSPCSLANHSSLTCASNDTEQQDICKVFAMWYTMQRKHRCWSSALPGTCPMALFTSCGH